jgi:hypothetical protein
MAPESDPHVVSGPEARRGQGAGPEDKRVISGIEAKQGVKLGVMRYVLIISMSLVILGFVVVWVVQRL